MQSFPKTATNAPSPEELDRANRCFIKARTAVIFENPILSPCIFKLESKYVLHIPTMATDGYSLMYNPHFINNLPKKYLRFCILHELFHCILRTQGRRGDRDKYIWNLATDFIINSMLVYDEHLEAPDWILLDPKYSREEWEKNHPDNVPFTAESVYDELIKDAKEVKIKFTIICPCCQGDPSKKGKSTGKNEKEKQEGGKDQDGGGGGDTGDTHEQTSEGEGDEKDSDWNKELDESWKQAVVLSEQMARMRGDVPGWLTSLVQEIVEPNVPLDKILLQYIGTIVSDETTWKYPNRRFIQRNIYLPSRLANKRDGIVIIDTSGSISNEDAHDFLGMVLKVVRSKGINEIRLIQNDTRIVDDVRIKNVSQFKSHIKEFGIRGRGGTSFVEVFETLEKEKIWSAAFILVLTDLEADFPAKTPRCPTVWVSIEEKKAPFGTTIFWDRHTRKIKVIRK